MPLRNTLVKTLESTSHSVRRRTLRVYAALDGGLAQVSLHGLSPEGLVSRGPCLQKALSPEGLVSRGPCLQRALSPEGLVFRGPCLQRALSPEGLVSRGPCLQRALSLVWRRQNWGESALRSFLKMCVKFHVLISAKVSPKL